MPPAPPRTREKYVHLYMPFITAALILSNRQIMSQLTHPNTRPQDAMLFVAFSALPTYVVGSYMYPPNLPEPTPDDSARFTRKHDAYRALVLFTYGRLFGTPFNLQFLIADFVLSYVAGYAMGERTRQRRSEFLVALLWVAGSWVTMAAVPPSMSTLSFLLVAIDRTLWRAAWLALVDDVVAVLSRPNVRTLRGKVTLVLVQAFTITGIVWFVLAWVRRWNEGYFRSQKSV